MKRIGYSKDATKVIRRLPANVAGTIRSKIEQYAADPASLANNVKSLKGESGVLRLRIGDWRVVFAEEAEFLTVIRIGPRGVIYD